MAKHTNALLAGREAGEAEDDPWKDPRWTERGVAPRRSDAGCGYGSSIDALFSGGGSRQVPEGLIKQARDGGSEDGEDNDGSGVDGSGGDGEGDDGLLVLPNTEEAENQIITLPGLSQLELESAGATEMANHILAHEPREQCTEKQKEYIRR